MRLDKLIFLCLAAVGLSCPARAQFVKGMNYAVEAGASFSGGEHTPFWLNANRYGLSSVEKNNGYLRAGIFRPYEEDKHFSYRFGLDLAGAWRSTSAFVVQQAYLDLRYRWFELSVGSKERPMELKNQALSSGGMTFSNNARPVPQVRVCLPEYVAIPGTKGLFSIKGHLAYGCFTDDGWQRDFIASDTYKHTENVLFHSKALYARIGNEDRFPLVFEGGLEMAAQFGGKAYENGSMTDMPNDLKAFFKALIPAEGSSDTPLSEQTNIYGNHVGSWMFSLSYKFPDWKLRTYYDHFFEDHSMMFGQYGWKDCLVGVELTLPENPFAGTLVYEYIGTRDQSGPIFHDATDAFPFQISAIDDYYNHYIYNGWQHWGMAIGNPLLVSPVYNGNGLLRFRSTRMQAHHVGLSGRPSSEWDYRLLFSYARHWGTYFDPLPDVENNINALLEATYCPVRLGGWSFTASVAADFGDLLGKSAGGMLTVRKAGLLSKNKNK